MKLEFLNRLDTLEVPVEFKNAVDSITPLLASDEDLNHTYCTDKFKIGFTRIGSSATLQICEEWDDFQYPLLVAGF